MVDSWPPPAHAAGTLRSEATQLLQLIKDRFLLAGKTENGEGDEASPAKPMPWYPDELGWTINASRAEIRRAPRLEELRKFLVVQTELVRPGGRTRCPTRVRGRTLTRPAAGLGVGRQGPRRRATSAARRQSAWFRRCSSTSTRVIRWRWPEGVPPAVAGPAAGERC